MADFGSGDNTRMGLSMAQMDTGKILQLSQIPEDVIETYRRRFDAIDLNKDGIITLRELATIGRVFGYRLSNEELQTIFHKRDLDDSGGITFEEFVIAMVERAAQNKRAMPLREKFKEWDTKKKGYITADEAHPVLERELGFDLSKTEGLVDLYDVNRDYRISIHEFIDFYYRVQDLKDELRKAFRDFDTNNDGFVDFDEAKAKMCPKGFSDADIKAFFVKYDQDRDGKLNYYEFAKFWDIPIY